MRGPTALGKRGSEVGQTVASFPSYDRAQKTVSALIAGEVPARDIAIVGQGLRSIERVTGRLGYATAARSGAVNGLLLGLFFSALFVLSTPDAPIQAFVGVLFVGIAIGMLISLVSYSIIRRRRDYASVMQVVADHYEVTVQAASLTKARGVLGQGGGADASASAPPAPRDPATLPPPRYGERILPPPAGPPADTPAPPAPPAPPAAPPAADPGAPGDAPADSPVATPTAGEAPGPAAPPADAAPPAPGPADPGAERPVPPGSPTP